MKNLELSLEAATIERTDAIRALMLGVVSREHVLFVGPPGTGKSYLCRCLAAGISGARYAERLLSPTSPPEAVFGPVSLSALREDRYEHVSTGSVTDAEIVFLDEFSRASPAIRDTLLHLLGPERQALVGTQQVKAPLRFAIAAGNSWPEDASDAAILDRWTIRVELGRISPAGMRQLIRADLPPVTPQVTLEDVDMAAACAGVLPVSTAAYEAMDEIMAALSAEGIVPSERRLRSSMRVARAAAVLDNSSEVLPKHLEDLRLVLWDAPGQAQKAGEIISRIANPAGARVAEILVAADEIVRSVGTDAAARISAVAKLTETERELISLGGAGNGRATKVLAHVRMERARLQAAALGLSAEHAEKLAQMAGGNGAK